MTRTLIAYIDTIADRARWAEVTFRERPGTIPLYIGIYRLRRAVENVQTSGCKIIFVGNGGSAGIASHLAIDYSKNHGFRSVAFNDAAALTCLANDLGYEQVFAKQIEMHARADDLLIAISSSGKSPNILAAVEAARKEGARVVTFSGFDPANPLRELGDLNFYINSNEYGCVEIAHLTLLHAVIDLGKEGNE